MPQLTILLAFHPDDEWDAVRSTPLGFALTPLSCSSWFDDIDLNQELLDEERRRKLMIKKQKLEDKLKTKKEHHLALLDSFGMRYWKM